MPKTDDKRRDSELLGLEISASEDDRKRAFIKLAINFHPDRGYKGPDEISKSRFHEICKAYKRLTSEHGNTSDWNTDKSDEIFFSLLGDSLQNSSKSGALYALFDGLPSQDSQFQSDNEYRCKEDALDDEDEETEFNKLIAILTNRLQNGKSVPAGLTQDKISRLKEDFVRQKEACRKSSNDKCSAPGKKPKPPVAQVPVTKPKPKSKKQLLAEQRRREMEMAKIAEELEEKKKKEEEREQARKQLEAEKQKKFEEEQKRVEEERKKAASEAKKRKEREEKEREQRLQKEKERQDRQRRQQEEEQRRKEEEKKRKAEEKAAKAKATKELKEKKEKEDAENAKKQNQNNKRQQQFQQYQQQQQKYPREVPPRFLRMQQRQQQMQQQTPTPQDDTQSPQLKTGVKRKDPTKWQTDDTDWNHAVTTDTGFSERTPNMISWTDIESNENEDWGKELSNTDGSSADWGGVPVTEDWDLSADESKDFKGKDTWLSANTETSTAEVKLKENELKITEPMPIGSELKSGKIPKRENFNEKSESDNVVPSSSTGQFGAIGDRSVSNTPTFGTGTQSLLKDTSVVSQGDWDSVASATDNKPVGFEKNIKRGADTPDNFEKTDTFASKASSDAKIPRTLPATDVPISTSNTLSEVISKEDVKSTWSRTPGKSKPVESVQKGNVTSGPRLTGWSGLDAFEPIPSTSNSSVNLNSTVEHPKKEVKSVPPSPKNIPVVPSPKMSPVLNKAIDNKPNIGQTIGREQKPAAARNLFPSTVSENKTGSTAELSNWDANSAQASNVRTTDTAPAEDHHGAESDEWGWTTASSKKAKQKPATASPAGKDANAWMSRSLKQLLDMGFRREDAEKALKDNNGIIESAVSDLLTLAELTNSQPTQNHIPAAPHTEEMVPQHDLKEMDNEPSPAEAALLDRNKKPQTVNTELDTPEKLNRKQRRKLQQQQQQLLPDTSGSVSEHRAEMNHIGSQDQKVSKLDIPHTESKKIEPGKISEEKANLPQVASMPLSNDPSVISYSLNQSDKSIEKPSTGVGVIGAPVKGLSDIKSSTQTVPINGTNAPALSTTSRIPSSASTTITSPASSGSQSSASAAVPSTTLSEPKPPFTTQQLIAQLQQLKLNPSNPIPPSLLIAQLLQQQRFPSQGLPGTAPGLGPQAAANPQLALAIQNAVIQQALQQQHFSRMANPQATQAEALLQQQKLLQQQPQQPNIKQPLQTAASAASQSLPFMSQAPAQFQEAFSKVPLLVSNSSPSNIQADPTLPPPAPQQSKLFQQWRQPSSQTSTPSSSADPWNQTSDSAAVVGSSVTPGFSSGTSVSVSWGMPSMSSLGSSASAVTNTTSVLAHQSYESPVTVDPVSARWGVLAAPRLSPTPAEFKPGVPWKPKAELEKEVKEKEAAAQVIDITTTSLESKQHLENENEKPTENNDVDPSKEAPLSQQPPMVNQQQPINKSEQVTLQDIKFNANAVRPPPGLTNANAFENLKTQRQNQQQNVLPVQPDALRIDPVVAANQQSDLSRTKEWVIIRGLGATVDQSALRSLCQQYGLVLSFTFGLNMAAVCYETQKQATDAVKGLNGKVLFDCQIIAEIASADEVRPELKSWAQRPTIPGKHFPVEPFAAPGLMSNLWDRNSQMNPALAPGNPTLNPVNPVLSPINPVMNPVMAATTTTPLNIAPPGMFGLGAQLGPWGTARTDPMMTPGYWSMNMQPGGLMGQVPSYGPWAGTTNIPGAGVVTTATAMSPSMTTKLLPDGLFNGSEST